MNNLYMLSLKDKTINHSFDLLHKRSNETLYSILANPETLLAY